jgi:uncharacterized protein (DUF924 family)
VSEQNTPARLADRDWAAGVLRFWFEELGASGWFKKSEAADAEITARFEELHRDISGAPIEALLADRDAALAAVIVLDQFARNMFRGKLESFATDAKALDLARRAIELSYDDRDLPVDWRVFFYLPFEHSEELADQHRAVELISALGNAEYTKYAIAHLDVIERFGRFPHRNAILGRTSTPEEAAYLAEPGSGF